MGTPDRRFALALRMESAAFTGGPAFADDAARAEVARILRAIADRLDPERFAFVDLKGVARDLNGNEVGWWAAFLEEPDVVELVDGSGVTSYAFPGDNGEEVAAPTTWGDLMREQKPAEHEDDETTDADQAPEQSKASRPWPPDTEVK